MGTRYTSNSDTGYNASPPPDDGTASAANQINWAKHKTKLTDPILAYLDDVNTDLIAHFDVDTIAKSTIYTTTADDDRRTVECTSSPTITLGAAASMGTGYSITVKCVSGTTTVATSDTIDGSASNRTLVAGASETYVVNQAASAYLIQQLKGITASSTDTLTNKTLEDPVINVAGTDAEGDLYYRNASGVFTRLPIGTADGQIIVVSSGIPAWTGQKNGAAGQAVFTEYFESASPASITGAGFVYTENHGLSGIPKLYSVSIRCTNAAGDDDYSENDEINMSHIVGTTNDRSSFADATLVGVGSTTNWTGIFGSISSKDGSSGSLSLANWGWVIRAWY